MKVRVSLPTLLLLAMAGGCVHQPVPLETARAAPAAPQAPTAAVALAPVDAGTWFRQTQETFHALDRNSDRRIDLAEIRAGFSVLDLDHDGYLSGHEALSLIEAADRDGDGRLTREELAALPPVKLVIDLDGNGNISPFELTLARTDDFGRVDLDGDRRLDPQELRTAERFSYFRF